MIVSGVIAASWVWLMLPWGAGRGGLAGSGVVPDVVQVGPAGLAPGEPAPAVVPLPGGAADRGAGSAPPPS